MDKKTECEEKSFDSDDSVLNLNVNINELDTSNTDSEDKISDEGQLETEANIEPSTSRNMKKNLRNNGKSYISSSGKIVPCRAMRLIQPCRNKCKDKITPEQQQVIHELYWQLGSYQLRQAFVAGLIEIHSTKTVRRDKSETNPRNRMNTYKYYLEISGQRVLVCQKCFKGTLCESDQFLKTVAKKKIEGYGAFTDQRGKHRNPKKLPVSKEKEVIKFINSFPSYESHYTRRDTSKKYLTGDLSVAVLHRLYCENYDHSISISKFSQIFHTLNLKFKKPKLDTCHKCDMLNSKIKVAEAESLDDLKAEQADHHHQAKQAFESKRNDKQKASADKNVKVFSFDLQQCLPTPFLRSSVSFYKRPLWTFNLTVHDCSTNEPFCYMWHEALAKRGGNDIASCLFQHLQNLPLSVNHVIFYSDCCPGQNKNSFVATMFAIFMQLADTTGSISIIDHKFMVPGHTHMECDSDHALIEKKKKVTSVQIHHPRDWYQFIRTVGVKRKFCVIEMNRNQFFDFASAAKELFLWRKVDDDGQKYSWADIKWLRITKEFGSVFFKSSLDENEPFRKINLRKRGISSIKKNNLKQCYFSPLEINQKKKQDLIDMLPLIDEIYKDFYLNLRTADMLDFHPDLTEADEIFE